jgi:hypothetical protein
MSSLDDLRSDLSKKDLASMASLPVDVRQYFASEVWPFHEAMLDYMGEQDEIIAELIEQTDDFLHGATAKELGKPIGVGFAIADELEKRLGPSDTALRTLIGEYRASAQTALATLREISADDDEEDEDGTEGEDEEGDEEEVAQ